MVIDLMRDHCYLERPSWQAGQKWPLDDEEGRRQHVADGARECDVVGVPLVEVVNMPKRRPFVGDRLLTVGEVAGTMRVSNMTVYRLIKAGQLAAIRVGKNYRIRESDVNKYLSDRSVRVEEEK
jgi:excisionase family DNA binding protein